MALGISTFQGFEHKEKRHDVKRKIDIIFPTLNWGSGSRRVALYTKGRRTSIFGLENHARLEATGELLRNFAVGTSGHRSHNFRHIRNCGHKFNEIRHLARFERFEESSELLRVLFEGTTRRRARRKLILGRVASSIWHKNSFRQKKHRSDERDLRSGGFLATPGASPPSVAKTTRPEEVCLRRPGLRAKMRN